MGFAGSEPAQREISFSPRSLESRAGWRRVGAPGHEFPFRPDRAHENRPVLRFRIDRRWSHGAKPECRSGRLDEMPRLMVGSRHRVVPARSFGAAPGYHRRTSRRKRPVRDSHECVHSSREVRTQPGILERAARARARGVRRSAGGSAISRAETRALNGEFLTDLPIADYTEVPEIVLDMDAEDTMGATLGETALHFVRGALANVEPAISK